MFENLGWFFATIIGAVAMGSAGFMLRLGSSRHEDARAMVLAGLYLSGTFCFILSALVQESLTTAPTVILGGVIIGLGSVIGNLLWITAFRYGPTSLAGPIINLYNVLVIVMSVLFFGERLTVHEFFGLGLILISLALISYDPNEALRIKNRLWYVLLVASMGFFFVRTGGLKITEELGMNNTTVLAYGYGIGLLWCGRLVYRQEQRPEGSMLYFTLGWGLLSGIFSFGGMQLFAYAIERGPASIISPIFSMSGLVFALLTITIMHERLSRHQAAAMIGCVAGLVILRI